MTIPVTGVAAVAFTWSTSSIGISAEPVTGTIAATFGWGMAAAGFTPIHGTIAVTWGWSVEMTSQQTTIGEEYTRHRLNGLMRHDAVSRVR